MGIGIGISFSITESILPELSEMKHRLNLIGNELKSVADESQEVIKGIKGINEELKNTVSTLTKIVAIKSEITGSIQTTQNINKKVLELNAALKDKEPAKELKNTTKEVLQLNAALKDRAPAKEIENTSKKVINLKKSADAAKTDAKKLFDEFKQDIAIKKVSKLESKIENLKKSMRKNQVVRKFFGFFKRGTQKARDGLEGILKGNNKFFNNITEQFPSLGRFAHLLKNPYVLAAAAAAALIVATVKLGQHLTQVSQEIARVERSVKFGFGANSQAEISELSRKVIALRTEFQEIDTKEFLGAAKVMSREFGIQGKESFKLLKQGLQATGGQLDIDQLKEYSTQLKSVGLTADQTMGLIVKAFQEGAYQDKAPDLLREAKNRLLEMPKGTSDALNKLGDSFGRLPEKLNATSKTGAKLTIQTVAGLKNALKTGEIDVMQSVQFITRTLGKLNNKDRQEVIANVFGGPGEDVGERFLLSLGKAELSMKKMVNLQDPYIQAQNKRLGMEEKIVATQQEFAPDFNNLKRGWDGVVQKARLLFYKVISGGIKILKNAFGGGDGANPIQLLGNAVDWVAARLRDAKPFFIDIITALGGFKRIISFILKPVFWLIGLIKRLVWDTGILQKIFKVGIVVFGLFTNPVMTIILLFTRLYRKSLTVRATLGGMWAVVKSLIEPFRQLGNVITGIVEFNPIKIKNALSGAWKAVRSINPLKDFKAGYAKVIKDAEKARQAELAKKAKPTAGKKSKPDKKGKSADPDTPTTPDPVTTPPNFAGISGGAGGGASAPGGQSVANLIGGSNKTENRNLTINIKSLVENFTIQSTSIQEGAQDIEQAIKEALLRAIRNTEAIY